jgi:hypothetical protein
MVWILLAALGIPLWIVAGALIATLLSRRQFKRAPGAFPAKLRIVSGDVPGLKDSWPRRPLLARWTHDVLVVQRGLALVRCDVLGVTQATGSLTTGDPDAIRGLGAEPLLLTVVLDHGASVELAAPADAKSPIVGPFAGVLLSAGGERSEAA